MSTPPAAAAAPQGRAALAAWFSYISRMLCWACHPGEGAMVHKITRVVSFCSNLGAAESPTIAAAILCSCLATVRVRECVPTRACQQLTPCRWVLMPEEVSCEALEAEWAQLARGGGCALARLRGGIAQGLLMWFGNKLPGKVQERAVPQVHRDNALVSAQPFPVGRASPTAPGGQGPRRPP